MPFALLSKAEGSEFKKVPPMTNPTDWETLTVNVTLRDRRNGIHTVRLTNADLLEFARAIQFEGQPYLAVAYALLQRWGFLFPVYRSFGTFIKAYAQPINPRWFPDGDLHRREVERIRNSTTLTEAQRTERIADLNRRATNRLSMARTPWNLINTRTRDTLAAVLAGAPSPVAGAVHYNASPGSRELAEAKARRLGGAVVDSGSGYGRTVNAFYSMPGSSQFDHTRFRFSGPFDKAPTVDP